MKALLRFTLWLIAVLTLAAGAAWWWAKPPAPDAFYADLAEPLSGPPGAVIRSKAVTAGVPPGAKALRIIYITTDRNGDRRMGSAVVAWIGDAPDVRRPIIAWAHGTSGVLPGCAPSLEADPFQHVPALDVLLGDGWLLVAPDYPGLGTSGVHTYLVGEDEGRAVLDAVRAARNLSDIAAGDQTVVWGHSQGGHAALWTGILQPAYAPDVPLSGVAAMAPATDLIELLRAAQGTPIGRILTAYLLVAYEAAYGDVPLDATARDGLGWFARDMATRCLSGPRALVAAGIAAIPVGTLLASDPAAPPLGSRLTANAPAQPISAPLWIAQGEADQLISPAIQARFVAARCAAGQALVYRTYPALDHLSLVAPGSPAEADLVAWTMARLANEPQENGCPG